MRHGDFHALHEVKSFSTLLQFLLFALNVLRLRNEQASLCYFYFVFITVIKKITDSKNSPVFGPPCIGYTFFVNSPTGHTPQRIFTRDGSKDAFSRKDVPFAGSLGSRSITTTTILFLQCRPNSDAQRRLMLARKART